jgi:hypothetical protein
MNNLLYIFQYTDKDSFNSPKSVTVVFVHQEKLPSQEYLADEIKLFFERHIISDYLVVLLPDYLDENNKSWFFDTAAITFKRLPGRSQDYFDHCYFVYTYRHGQVPTAYPKKIINDDRRFIQNLYRHGSTHIFKHNGGLVESSNDHHFVFPSNKHCSKFIRTGNVLVNGAEIFFLAFQLLPHFDGKETVYCDTSSINVLPFAVFELKRRFGDVQLFPAVESFKSYDVFESRKIPFKTQDLVLISSSTSGNIIDRLIANHLASKEQIALVYYLGPKDRYQANAGNIICDLTKDEKTFPEGVEEFETYPNDFECRLCRSFSHPVAIHGDVFLTVKPKIEKVLLTATPKHVPRFLNEFVTNYRVDKRADVDGAVIRSYYKETKGDDDANYETYIDTSKIYGKPKFEEKLDRLIDKHIPANTKYLVYLPDQSSQALAELINKKVNWQSPPTLIRLDDALPENLENINGCAVIVASCIVTGKNLLHVSMLMRRFPNLSLTYFIGVLGTSNETFQNTLKSSLTRGKDKSDERPFIAVETIYCSLDKYHTIWEKEKLFLEEMVADVNEDGPLYPYLIDRIKILRANKETIGLSDDVFLQAHNRERLYLRKNFAFWNFEYEEKEIFQSEVYFSMNSIINFLENKEVYSGCSLKQSTYVRNILSIENFTRFNDGIIQACLLRAARPECLAYDLDAESSQQMRVLIESMIDKKDTEHGEALMEFLLALGLKTLRLKKSDTEFILKKATGCGDPVIAEFTLLIQALLQREHVI